MQKSGKLLPGQIKLLPQSELTDHNDVYWDSHRMWLNPRRKKAYLKDFQQNEN